MQRTGVDWDTLTWSFGERWTATVPGKPLGTHVQYTIEVVTPDGQTLRSPHLPPPSAIVTEEDRQTHRLTLETRARMASPRVYAYRVDREQSPTWL